MPLISLILVFLDCWRGQNHRMQREEYLGGIDEAYNLIRDYAARFFR